jgi:histidinol dehydrogenase
MQLFNNPDKQEWKSLLLRPYIDNTSVLQSVRAILSDVKQNGDSALKRLAKQFDGADLKELQVSKDEITEAGSQLSAELKTAIQQAKQNIATFHSFQMHKPRSVETMQGIECWRKSVGIEKVGLYIPGGTAPLFSTILMLGIPAAIAGCKEVILCSPSNKQGKLHPAILYTANLVGIKKIFMVGGAQAIAAMAYGTVSIPAVYKIFGPGNQYVTAAKQLVQVDGVAIDMPAGPSEVCVLADETANPAFIASDLLSQAEHGVDSQVFLVSNSESLVHSVLQELEMQLEELPRKDLALKALQNSKAIVVGSIDDAIEVVNEYAAEHLIICCEDADSIAEQITNAGSVFIGNYSPESVGDYASGTNHTLPTNAFARAYSGVSVDSFVKKITFQKLTRQGLQNIAETVIEMAEAEGLKAHANAVRVRISEPAPLNIKIGKI